MARFTQGFAAKRFRPAAPATAASALPRTVKVSTMPSPYRAAVPTARPRVAAALLVKYDTVIGTIGNTHGVSNDNAPIEIASQRNALHESALAPNDSGAAGTATAATGNWLLTTGNWLLATAFHFTGTVSDTVVGGRHRRLVHAW